MSEMEYFDRLPSELRKYLREMEYLDHEEMISDLYVFHVYRERLSVMPHKKAIECTIQKLSK